MHKHDLHLSLWIVGLVVLHRLVQWWLLQDQVDIAAALNGDVTFMQLLPASLWREHFWAALTYLQQTPPIPNLIYGIAASIFVSAPALSTCMILLAGLLSAISGVLLAQLLLRMALPRWLCGSVALVFATSTELVMIEYFAFGQSFYGLLTMNAVLCAALAAQAFARSGSVRAACALGIAIAFLALTRASFSYFALPALFWLLIQHTRGDSRRRVVAGFLIPIVLLHGGWALKQKIVQGEFLWATSSWSGLNTLVADARRAMARLQQGKTLEPAVFTLNDALPSTPCLARWQHLTNTSPFLLFSEEFNRQSPSLGPSARAMQVDAAAAQARGVARALDSAALREFSQCVQQAKLMHWLQHPLLALSGAWQSYGVFWSPLIGIAETVPTVLIPAQPLWRDPAHPPLWSPQGDLFSPQAYLIRQQQYRHYYLYAPEDLAPATVIGLPLLPPLLALCAMVILHASPIALIACRRWRRASAWPAGFSFLLLTYVYLAGISSLVEYGENMRFRIEVEPLIWAIALVCLRVAIYSWRSASIGSSSDARHAGRMPDTRPTSVDTANAINK